MTRNSWQPALATIIFAATPGFCDMKITTAYTTDGQTEEATIYANGTRVRYDYGKGVVLLRKCDQKSIVEIDDKNRSYLSIPAEPNAEPKSEKTEAIDTGESKEMFGYSARHLKSVEKIEGKKDRTETDGWYADVPALGSCSGQDAEAAKRGYPLQYTTTRYGENGKPTSTIAMKVTALETAPIEAAMFEVPAGYADSAQAAQPKATKEPGAIRVGAVAMRSKTNQKGQGAGAFEHLVAQLAEAKIDVLPLPDAPPDAVGQKAREMQCDYVLYTELASVDKASTGKLGGMLHKAPGLGKMTGGEPFEARVDYSLLPGAGGSALLSGTATGKTASTFNWKSAALLASNMLPMVMAAKMFSGAMNPAMLNALASGQGTSMAQMDPMMGGISMFLQATGAGQGANASHTNQDTAIAAALEQEGKAVIAQVKNASK